MILLPTRSFPPDSCPYHPHVSGSGIPPDSCPYHPHVSGSGIPEGVTAYVLTEEATARWLWNPCTGQRSGVSESYSSLISVGCLINAENVSY